MATCAEDIDLESYGIEHNRCIDGELMKGIFSDDKGISLLSSYIEMAGKRYVWRTSANPAEDEKCKRFRSAQGLRMYGE